MNSATPSPTPTPTPTSSATPPPPSPTPSVTCLPPFKQNKCTDECDECLLDADEVCNGRSAGFELDCVTCDCLPCSHGGVLVAETGDDACLCDCPAAFPAIAGGDCGECARDSSFCNNHGTLSQVDCETCTCDDCSNGGSNDERCACECVLPFASNEINTDCTACALSDNEACNNRGTLNDDCVTCECIGCSNGAVNDDQCLCQCTDNWIHDDRGDCTTCSRDASNFCNSRGSYDRTACGDACNACLDCAHDGNNTDTCECECAFPWATGADADCSVCLRTNDDHCNGRGEVGADCETCFCTTPCSNGGVIQDDCTCDCTFSAFDADSNGDCTVCNRGSEFCNGRGTPSDDDCSTCVCDDCTNGGFNNRFCQCQCPFPWDLDADLDCTECGRSSDECNYQPVSADCLSCDCQNSCAGGEFLHPDCSCDTCEFPFRADTSGDCTVCLRSPESFCNQRGDVVNCESCDCNVDCSNGGVRDDTDCSCNCESSAFDANPYSGDCIVCSIGSCPGNGRLNSKTCECECQPCVNGDVDPDTCTCICDVPWGIDGTTGQCTSCTLSGALECSNRGSVSQSDCATCLCTETSCSNGGTQDSSDCSCDCIDNWLIDDETGDCTQCGLIATLSCQNGGFINTECTACQCPDCGTFSTNVLDDCTCECDAFHAVDESGLCNACSRPSSEVCQRGGVLDPTNCRDCICEPCGNNSVELRVFGERYDCACECLAPFAADEETGFCTECVDDCLCVRGGVRDPLNNCETCVCPSCANGATTNANCSCTCPERFGKNAQGECTRCLLDDDIFCSGRGFVNATCDGCICTTCGNGQNSDDCLCVCEDPWEKDDEGACTICPISCDGSDEVLDLTTCSCQTCPFECDDQDECTTDTCVAANCQFVLIEDCARCLNITDCEACGNRDECTWVNCDDDGLLFGNGSIIRLTDLETDIVGVARARLRAEQCDEALANNDEEAAFESCDGLRLEVCLEEVDNDNVDRIFEVCPLDTLCPEALASNDQIFYQRFCVPGADGTLSGNQAAGESSEDSDSRRQRRAMADPRSSEERVAAVREMHRRAMQADDYNGYDFDVTVDGISLEVEDVAEILEADDNRCIPIVLNSTLQCRGVDCSSTDNKLTAESLSIAAAVGGGTSAAGGIAFFGAAWGLAAFRQNTGTPLDVPEAEFDATSAFANINDDMYVEMDGMTQGLLYEGMQ